MVTENSHRLIMGKTVVRSIASSCLIGSSPNLQIIMTANIEFGRDWTAGFGITRSLTDRNVSHNGENFVRRIATLFLIGASSNLQINRTGIKSRLGLNSSQIE